MTCTTHGRPLSPAGWLAIALGVWTALAAGGTPPPPSPETAAAPTSPTPRSFAVTVSGEGRPMVLIPGLLGSGEVWDGAVARYRDRYRLHVLTLAGFAGQPPPADGPFLPAVRDDLVRYLDEAKLADPVLVGHSLGGFLAFAVAAAAPERVGAVVAVDGVPFLPALFDPAATAESARPQAEAIRALYAGLAPEAFAAQNRAALAAMIGDPGQVERALAWANASDPRTTGRAVAELMTTDLRSAVAGIRAPVLLVAAAPAAADPASVESVRERYAAQVAAAPRHRVEAIGGARHFLMLDAPDRLFAALDAFLADPPGVVAGTAP